MNAIHTTTRALAAAAALTIATALLTGPAYAQTEGAPLSRAAVNEQTRAAAAAGQLLHAGEATPADNQRPTDSSKTRDQRKSETIEARRKGEIPAPGLSLYKSNMSQQTAVAHSTKTRAERKAETAQAAKEHRLMPAGEAG